MFIMGEHNNREVQENLDFTNNQFSKINMQQQSITILINFDAKWATSTFSAIKSVTP